MQIKLGQFINKKTSAPRLGLASGDAGVLDVAALAAAVKEAGGAVADWLLSVSEMREIIRRGDAALTELDRLSIEARERGVDVEARERGVDVEARERGVDVEARERGVDVEASAVALPFAAIEFLPPVYPGKILAIGRNYADHALEGGAEPPAAPLIFNKLPNALSAHNAPIVLPTISSQVDYEAELAVVIGRRARRVSEAEALDYVFGYTLINDVSARDLQFGDGQWVRGKGLDGFAPLGPFITPRAAVADVQQLAIEGRLNGEVMQSSNTSKMIFPIPYLISYISQGITLEPGDVIATGTPEGVGIFRKPPVLLTAGDVFDVTVEHLGTLSNPVLAADEQ